jgi:hypothetical protein
MEKREKSPKKPSNGFSCFCSRTKSSTSSDCVGKMNKNSRRKRERRDAKDSDDSQCGSSDESFYSVDDTDEDHSKYIGGPRAVPGKTFRMGESVRRNAGSSLDFTTFSMCDNGRFNVRIGPDYPRNGMKAPSLSALYEAVGVDVLRGNRILSNVAPHLMFPPVPDYYDPACKLPALLVVNTQLPLALPSLFTASENDPGWSCVGYFMIKKETVDWVLNSQSSTTQPPPAIQVFHRLLGKGFSERSLALKAIGMIHNIEDQDLPMMNILQKYNGKPVLVTASSTFHFGESPYPYLEIDYNVRKWSLLARTTLVQIGDKLKNLSCHIGYLVEATEDEDLPERMLGVVTVHNISVENARWVDFEDE